MVTVGDKAEPYNHDTKGNYLHELTPDIWHLFLVTGNTQDSQSANTFLTVYI